MDILKRVGIKLLWFDSLGVKSSSFIVETSKGKVIIDPGAAAMQPSYPLPKEEKARLRKLAIRNIAEYLRESVAAIITHYHYDHHFLPSDREVFDKAVWLKKLLIVKNPNMFINESQWGRSRFFLREIVEICNSSMEKYLTEPKLMEFRDPVEKLEYALSRNFGSYSARREELLRKGREWFNRLVGKLWSSKPWIKEFSINKCVNVVWGDGRTFEFGDTLIKVLEPWFHGLEYDRTGWVTPVIIRKNNYTVFYTSDVMGPEIEDYAYFIAKEKPDIVVLDGPPVYLFPYMLNRVNLERAIENAIRIVEAEPKLIIYDHHLLRHRLWRNRVEKVFLEAKKLDVQLLTAAECLGTKPLIDTLR